MSRHLYRVLAWAVIDEERRVGHRLDAEPVEP